MGLEQPLLKALFKNLSAKKILPSSAFKKPKPKKARPKLTYQNIPNIGIPPGVQVIPEPPFSLNILQKIIFPVFQTISTSPTTGITTLMVAHYQKAASKLQNFQNSIWSMFIPLIASMTSLVWDFARNFGIQPFSNISKTLKKKSP